MRVAVVSTCAWIILEGSASTDRLQLRNTPGRSDRQSVRGRPWHAQGLLDLQPCVRLERPRGSIPSYFNPRQNTDRKQGRTKVSPLQRFVRQPHPEPSRTLRPVKFRDRQTRTIHRYRVANMTVVQDGRGVADGQSTAARIMLYRSDSTQVLNL